MAKKLVKKQFGGSTANKMNYDIKAKGVGASSSKSGKQTASRSGVVSGAKKIGKK
jgi:hypothetical protein